MGLHAKPDFYRLDVALKSPPGVYYAPRFGRKTRDERLLYDLIQAHLNSSSKGYEIVTNLGAAVLAQFPKSKNVRISVNPYIRGRFGLPGLTAVTLAYSIPSTYTGRRWSNYDPSVLVKTDWRLDVTKGSGVGLIDLGVSSVESPMSQLPSLLESPHRIGGDTYGQDPEANLGRLHPTFYMHQELMRSITVFQSDFGAAAALHFAKLGFDLADKQYMDKRLGSVTVGIKKVRSDPNEPSSACNISLSRTRYEQTKNSMIHSNLQPRWHRAYLALGSNVGDRLSMIEAACSEMNDRGIRISRTSALYETPAMYLEDQQSFINGACEVVHFPSGDV